MVGTFQKLKRIHFVGISGVAMAALAVYAIELGIKVTGSDIGEEFPTSAMLKQVRIPVSLGFRKEHIPMHLAPGLVVYTGAHGGVENPEVVEAVRRGIPTLAHGIALGVAMTGKRQISVAGSHGKTTTAAMLATVLVTGNMDPCYAVGCGEIFGLGASGHFGKGEFFVAEADEYVTDPGHDPTPRFLWQKPEFLIVTNIDYDHPDVYKTLGDIQKAFVTLKSKQVGQKITILSADDPASRVLKDGTNTVTFGFSPVSDLAVTHVGVGRERTFFTVSERGTQIGEFSLKVPGRHNVINAAAAIAVLRSLGLSTEHIRAGLLRFGGTKRRFEKVGTAKGVTIYDDYAHHPREIVATLSGVRSWYPNTRIITVFQPHTYSRTKALLYDFVKAFRQSDIVIFTEIYASVRENDTLGIDGKSVAFEAQKQHPRAVFAKNFDATSEYLQKTVLPGDMIIFMGAGDIYTWGKQFVSELIASE